MNRQALILFVRNPEPGKVKTRIARVAGDAEALRIYTALLRHTHRVAGPLLADKFVFYSNFLQQKDLWEEPVFKKCLQSGNTLGERMYAAFRQLFGTGYEKIVIIGSDCYELTTYLLEAAFAALDEKEVVIGPARDGGYYLLGMKNWVPGIFENKEWSTDTVFRQTADELEKAGVSFALLPVLADVDTLEDVPDALLKETRSSW